MLLSPLEESDVHEDLGESDLDSEIVPSSFITELKSARTLEDMLDVSAMADAPPALPLDCPVAPPLPPRPEEATLSFLLAPSDEMESDPDPEDLD